MRHVKLARRREGSKRHACEVCSVPTKWRLCGHCQNRLKHLDTMALELVAEEN